MALERIKNDKQRRYIDTETGKIFSRRQGDKFVLGIQSYEKKAAENRAKNLAAAVARPARGRTKATSEVEINLRLEAAKEYAENKRLRQLNKLASNTSKRIGKTKTIRPQLLKTGHIGVRLAAADFEQLDAYRKQAASVLLPGGGGKRLVPSVAYGVTGFDSRIGSDSQRLEATLITLQSPRVSIDEVELMELLDQFLEGRPYFIFSNWWIHLKFDSEYAQSRIDKRNRKNIPKIHRK